MTAPPSNLSNEIEDLLDKWFGKYATEEPDGSLTLVLHEIHGWENNLDDKDAPSPKEALITLFNKQIVAELKKVPNHTSVNLYIRDRIKELE